MKKFNFLFIFLVLFSFNFAFATDKPEWINNPDSVCPKDSICVVGNGTTPNSAKTDARNGILKFFETNVSAKFSSSLSTDEITLNSTKEEFLAEETEGILKGVKIQESFDDGKECYALAALDKKITAKELKSDIQKADSKMKLLVAENNIKYAKQLENLYIKRDLLNKKYLVLTGNMIPEEVSYEDIFQSRKNASETSLVYYLEPVEGYASQVSDILSNILIDNGAKVANNARSANRIATVSITKTDLFLNVNGFIKQMYSLKIETVDSNGEVQSNLFEEFTKTGRSEAQIKEIVNMNIKDYINTNIEQLLQ